MFKKIRLMVAGWLLPNGYYVDSLDPFNSDNPMSMPKIALGRSSAFNEVKNEMEEQYGLETWEDYMYNWVKCKNDETLKEIEAYKKSGKLTMDPYRSDIE